VEPYVTAGPAVLIISPFKEDHAALLRVLGGCHCDARAVGTCQEALAILLDQPVAIVICEHDLPDGTWQDIRNGPFEECNRPLLIVTSRIADEHLWVEVLNQGGYDVLAKPLDQKEVARVIDVAWRSWNQPQYQRPRIMRASNAGESEQGR
jgi:DNA-binding response OmpR family regulator